tara:strand:- start:533 stop:766 length:234 start_codon:yes stop_codon:yes gene_type:complete
LLLGHLPWHIHAIIVDIITIISNLLKGITHATVILIGILNGIVMDTIGGNMAGIDTDTTIVLAPFLSFMYTNGVVER